MNPGPPPGPSITLDSCNQALQRLVGGVVPQDELASLLETISSSENVISTIDGLQASDVQTFVDVIDTVRRHALALAENGSIDLCFNLLVRRWITPISSHAPGRKP
jgi:hypothetical protein